MLKLYEPFRDREILDNPSFFNSSDLDTESKGFFFAVFGLYFPLGSGSCLIFLFVVLLFHVILRPNFFQNFYPP